jgi:hypothetical protein
MTEQELRALVRDAIARQAMHGPGTHGHGSTPAAGATHASPAHLRLHPSHGLFTLPAGSDADGPCIIEPSVMCNHCGYCKSYGH